MSNSFDSSFLEEGRIEGVLFDIDDTLVDLRSAAIDSFLVMLKEEFRDVSAQQQKFVAEDFADDGAGAYERYMAGDLTFLGQRQLRLNRALELVNQEPLSTEEFVPWAQKYESMVKELWKPFEDVHPHLAALSDWGIPYGAVSNNIETYQRMKLESAGLPGFEVVIGSDTAGAPKPDAAPFLAGCAQLKTSPARTLYVGDNPVNDVLGAKNAGLVAVYLDRECAGRQVPALTVASLEELTDLISESLAVQE